MRQIFGNWMRWKYQNETRTLGILRLFLASAALCLAPVNSHADIIYVWSSDGTIQKFNANGVGTLFTTNNLSSWFGPVGLVLDNVGNLYAGVPGSSAIWKFLPDSTIFDFGFCDSVSGLAFDHTGNLFATLPNWNEIDLLTFFLGHEYGLFKPPGFTNYTTANLRSPISPVFDSTGKLYVVNNTNASYLELGPLTPGPYDNTVQRFTSNLTPLGPFATNLTSPWGLAFDRSGNLYVSDAADDEIYRFTPGGQGSTFSYGIAPLNSPRGLAFDSRGNLYVANAGSGKIVKIEPNGARSVFASGLNGPTSIAIYPGLNVWSASPISLKNPRSTPSGTFQFELSDNPGLTFTVLGTADVALPLTNWTTLGSTVEISPGSYQFIDSQATNSDQRFYRVVSP